MPYFTNIVSTTYPDTYAEYSSSYSETYSSEFSRSVSGNNQFSTGEGGYSSLTLHNQEYATITNSFHIKPFAKGKYGQGTYETGETRFLKELTYDTEDGQTGYANTSEEKQLSLITDSKGSSSTLVKDGEEVLTFTDSFNLESANIQIEIEMIKTISYDQNQTYYTTTKLKGSPTWYITSKNVEKLINGKLRQVKTWITSASHDNDYERTAIITTNNGTILSQKGTSQAEVQTRIGKTATILTKETFDRYDDVLVDKINVYPYNKKDSDGNSLKDSIFVLTKTTFTNAQMFSWFKSEQNRPECLSLIENDYVFSDTNYHIVHDSLNNTAEQKRQHKQLTWSVTYSKSRSDSKQWLAGVASVDTEVAQVLKTTESTRKTATTWSQESGVKSEKVAFPPNLSCKQDDAMAFTHKFAESNSFGAWSIENTLTQKTATIQTSVLTSAFMPWVESLHHVNKEESIGGWRKASDASGITLSTNLTQVTTESGITLIFETGPAGSDTTKTEIPEKTEERKYHEYDGNEATPLFAHVLPSTSTFRKLEFKEKETQYPFEYAKTRAVYKEPFEEVTRDSNGNRITKEIYTATTSEDVSEKYVSLSNTFTMFEPYKTKATAENSKETKENGDTYETTKSGIETETGNMSLYYADFIDAYMGEGEVTFLDLDIFGATEFSENLLSTTRIKAQVIADTIEGSQSFVTYSTIKKTFGEIQSSDDGTPTTETIITLTEKDGEEVNTQLTRSTFKQSHNIINDVSKYTQTLESGFSINFNSYEYALHGSIEFPYAMMFTGVSGYDGMVLEGLNTGEIHGKTSTESTYSAINYLGIEEKDFHPYRNAYKVTTQVYQGYNTHYHRAYDCIGKVLLQSSKETIIESTYYQPTTVSWFLDQGFLYWCASDYDDAVVELNKDWINDQGYQTTDCVEVIYSDNCDNTSIFGQFDTNSNAGFNSGISGNNSTFQTFFNNDGQIVDIFGNVVYDEDGNFIGNGGGDGGEGGDIRDPACDPFTWTWISTYHESTMTNTYKDITYVFTELDPIDMIPYWEGNQFYYGNLAYYEEFYTTADILFPEKNWKSPRDDYRQDFADLWIYSVLNGNDNGERISNIINHGSYDGRQLLLFEPRLQENAYLNSVPTSSIQPCVGSQKLISFTRYAQDVNQGLYPQYQNTIIGNNLYERKREFRRYFLDEKRRNDKFALSTKKFQSGVYGKLLFGNVENSKTYDDVIVMENEPINPIFFTNSNFYKKWLQNTHYTLTYTGTREFDTGAWFYKTQSRKVSTLVSGADGKYRAVYESSTSGTQNFTISYKKAEKTTFLNGNFILQTTNGTALQGLNIYNYAHPNCCPCATYGIWDRWRHLGREFTQIGSLDYQGQWRLKNDQVVGDRVMTINFLAIATAINDKSYEKYPLAIRLSSKSLSESKWNTMSYMVNGIGESFTLDDAILSYDVPEAFIVNQKHIVGLEGTQSVYTIKPFISIERPILYDEYERVECFVGKKDPFLNKHLICEIQDQFFEENKSVIFDYAIDRRAKRNLNLPKQFINERVANQINTNTETFYNMNEEMRMRIQSEHERQDFSFLATQNNIADYPLEEDE